MAGPLVGIGVMIAGALSLLLGLTLLTLGIRGRRINDHPVCRSCRFDLVGIYGPSAPAPAGTSPRCPECGVDLAGPRAVRHGQRRRRRGMLWAGAALLLMVVGAGGGAAWGNARGFNWNAVKPFWMLMYEAQGRDQAAATGALTELAARLSSDKLNPGQIRTLIDGGLSTQADSAAPFVEAWGEVIGAATKAGHATPEDLERFVKQGLSITLRVRRRAPTGKQTLFIADFSPARLGNSGVEIAIVLDRTTLGGVVFDSGPYHAGPDRIRGARHGGRNRYIRGVVPAGVGRAELETRWRVGIVGPDENHPIAEWVQTERAEMEIVPGDEPVVILRADDDTLREVKGALKLTRLDATISPGMGNVLFGELTGSELPVDIVAQVVLRRGDREWRLGNPVELIRDGHGSASRTFLLRIPDDLPRGPMDVVLVPSAGSAEANSVADRILGSELVFEQFPIDWTMLDRQNATTGQK
jgi:hypothetical protein